MPNLDKSHESDEDLSVIANELENIANIVVGSRSQSGKRKTEQPKEEPIEDEDDEEVIEYEDDEEEETEEEVEDDESEDETEEEMVEYRKPKKVVGQSEDIWNIRDVIAQKGAKKALLKEKGKLEEADEVNKELKTLRKLIGLVESEGKTSQKKKDDNQSYEIGDFGYDNEEDFKEDQKRVEILAKSAGYVKREDLEQYVDSLLEDRLERRKGEDFYNDTLNSFVNSDTYLSKNRAATEAFKEFFERRYDVDGLSTKQMVAMLKECKRTLFGGLIETGAMNAKKVSQTQKVTTKSPKKEEVADDEYEMDDFESSLWSKLGLPQG